MTDTTSTPPRQPDDREDIAAEEALAALDVKDGYVHCLLPAGNTLVGADWPLDEARQLIETHGAEIAGGMALNMRHGVCIRKMPSGFPGDDRTLTAFFATREDWTDEQKKKQGITL
jgi:hypothetical protein